MVPTLSISRIKTCLGVDRQQQQQQQQHQQQQQQLTATTTTMATSKSDLDKNLADKATFGTDASGVHASDACGDVLSRHHHPAWNTYLCNGQRVCLCTDDGECLENSRHGPRTTDRIPERLVPGAQASDTPTPCAVTDGLPKGPL
ncbi:hypothetical protein E4U13_008373 [Claviceps humidiphila]|uniref:Uncharacterized protein n=1 Tax=Claviceps humidiphila TaxID=1294629 RepID=A0A9P7Q4R7_9HYPO|nr:hypothetical protein E4U13_008373 [Claviceps humidiphila]